MEVKKAYEVLQVPENASKKEIEKKFEIWMRRDRERQRQGIHDKEDFHMTDINQAYKTIQDHFKEREESSGPDRLGHPFWKKVDHFFYYYKFHMILCLILLFTLMYLIQSTGNNDRGQAEGGDFPPADVNILFFGDYAKLDPSALEKSVLAEFPEWKSVNIELTYVPDETKNAYDAAVQQKSVLTLMNDDYDIYIMSSGNLHRLKGMYQPLDRIEDELSNRLNNGQLVYTKAEGDSKKRLYGVDITNSDIFRDGNAASNRKIATIRRDAKNFENAMRWIKETALSGDRHNE